MKSKGKPILWFEIHWTKLLAQYLSSDIFNTNETGLYFRALPEHSYALKSEKAKGAKTNNERLTILCYASMNGEKRKLMVKGKSQNPRCFKGVKTLPVDYEANKNAWNFQKLADQLRKRAQSEHFITH